MKKNFILIALLIATCGVFAQSTVFTLDVKKIGAPVQPTMYGLFFEDINYAADGGLYAEKIKNRSFEFPSDHFMGWQVFGKVALLTADAPFERNPHYVRLSPSGHRDKHTGLVNEGFFGIGVERDAEYRFSVWARGVQGTSKIRVQLIDSKSQSEQQQFASQDIEISSAQWKKYEIRLKSTQTLPKAELRIYLVSPNPADLEHVSLFPVDTWKGRENGLRKDLAQALADIHPGIFRFPGGCIVEGTDLNTRYNWKNSVGAVENRPLNENRWQYTFTHRFFPDYFQTYGMGFFEFFQLCEDIGAEPLPVISVGLACQFQNGLDAHVPVAELQPYIQDALDLIEFANGDVSSVWGKLRAEMGHPAPFAMKFLAIGNEQWGEEYPAHLEPFLTAIRAKYPEIKIVGSSGPDSEGKQFDYLWPEMRRLKADLVDEHFYRPEAWFLAQGARYDNYDRKGPKVFAGEYACHGRGKKWNHFYTSLLEAAFMTGLERNADVVQMATYAPLFAHIEGWQWRPDMIWFDNLRSMKSVSYYVQQLYATNKGTNVLSLTQDGKPICGAEGQNGLFASSVLDKNTGEIIVKIANTSATPQKITLMFSGLKKKESIKGGEIITLHSDSQDAENTLDNPTAIVPQPAVFDFNGKTFDSEIGAESFVVLKFKK
ncbi:MAG: carbohydrate binding domain-containing protein [Candidatus Symbiothrix sp.]|jgi:alpha-L-arabinofuranosidase|nr:carbohydrate binding domain-containing protein [Candidatus Symbiothrix sp.]